MPRRSMSYRKLAALEDARKLGQLTALEDLGKATMPDPSAEIPGTGPEKLIFNYLKRLRIRFQFQYHETDLESTAYPEDIYIPDFILPDYNTRINVFGTYWHSLTRRREGDIFQIARNLYAGRMIIEHGIPLEPSVGGANGKYVIWWEYEIYIDLPHLFSRDLPELFSLDRITGQPEEYILDREEEERRTEARKAAMVASRLRPRIHPLERELKRLRKRTLDLTRIYPFLRRMKEDVTYRVPKGIYETRGRSKRGRYSSLKQELEKHL